MKLAIALSFILIAASCISTALALNCYDCDPTKGEENCEKVVAATPNGLCRAEENVCLTFQITSSNSDQFKKGIYRGCSTQNANANKCELQKADMGSGVTVEHCSVCNDTLCNSQELHNNAYNLQCYSCNATNVESCNIPIKGSTLQTNCTEFYRPVCLEFYVQDSTSEEYSIGTYRKCHEYAENVADQCKLFAESVGTEVKMSKCSTCNSTLCNTRILVEGKNNQDDPGYNNSQNSKILLELIVATLLVALSIV